jgi:hypothetical protein
VAIPTHAERRASEELSEALETLLAETDEETLTLGMARDQLQEPLAEEGSEPSIYAELEALIEEYGEDAPALDFIVIKASGELAERIESILAATQGSEVVNIGHVREAVKEGLIDPDAEQVLLDELDDLIERYGEDTPAEDLVRFD